MSDRQGHDRQSQDLNQAVSNYLCSVITTFNLKFMFSQEICAQNTKKFYRT